MMLSLGSRAGAIIAACWATMMYFGEQGYIESTRAIVSTARHIEQEYVVDLSPFLKYQYFI